MNKPAEKNVLKIKRILMRHHANKGSLIPILQDIQKELGYLSKEAINQIGKCLDVSANEIYGVATFYTQFRFSPPGEHTIYSCLGTACHVRGGQQILKELQKHLGIKAGQTTSDGKFDLQRVACLGCCALAPVFVVDGKVHAGMTVKKIPSILSQYSGKKDSKKK